LILNVVLAKVNVVRTRYDTYDCTGRVAASRYFRNIWGSCPRYLKGLKDECRKEGGEDCDKIALSTCMIERAEEFGTTYQSVMYTCTDICIKVRNWGVRRAERVCEGSNSLRGRNHGVTTCDPRYQKKLEMSLANKLYNRCLSRCVYDYEALMANEQVAYYYSGKEDCYKYVTEGRCFKKYEKAIRRAKKLCID